jgi:excisionase family DNA binding protein
MLEAFLTTSQAAKFLGVSPSRIRQLILEGRLPATKVGRDQLIKEFDLIVFAELPRSRTGRPLKIF